MRRGLKWLGILLVAAVAAGVVFQTAATEMDGRNYAPRGQLYNINGHQMHLYCIGEGSPTVVLEAGGYAESLWWYQVQNQLAEHTQVCSYDRAGLGWSEPDPQPGARTPAEIADELHRLLTNAGISGPYVMVGHSLGGMYVQMQVIQYSDEVAGMVLVDARHESLDPERPAMTEEQLNQDQPMNPTYEWLVRLGVVRLFGSSLVASLSPASENLPPETLAPMPP